MNTIAEGIIEKVVSQRDEARQQTRKLAEALREAADLRESDLDEADTYVQSWRLLLGSVPPKDCVK